MNGSWCIGLARAFPGASCRGCRRAATSQHTAPSPSSTAISGGPKVVHNWTIHQDPVVVNSIICN